MTSLLSLRGVSKRFGGVLAVNEIDLEVPEGQLTAVIGPNGAGKTTLFNIIAGAIAPSAGTMALDGVPLAGVPMHRRVRMGIARTFQNLRLMPDLTVLENVLLGSDSKLAGGMLADILGIGAISAQTSAASERAVDLLALVGMEGRLATPAGNLAYGEAKLVEFARALASEPRLLLLDEPAAGLPHAEAAAMAELIRKVAASGTTVLLVEHNMRLVMSVAEHIMVMAHGKAIAAGSPAEVRESPAVIEAYLGREEEEA